MRARMRRSQNSRSRAGRGEAPRRTPPPPPRPAHPAPNSLGRKPSRPANAPGGNRAGPLHPAAHHGSGAEILLALGRNPVAIRTKCAPVARERLEPLRSLGWKARGLFLGQGDEPEKRVVELLAVAHDGPGIFGGAP